jgi:hypothetical protein
MSAHRRYLAEVFPLVLSAAVAAVLWGPTPASASPPCHRGKASGVTVGRPTAKVAWRARLLRPTSIYRGIPGAGAPRLGSIGPRSAAGLLVLRAARDRAGGCWVKLRLPGRPNDADGWIDAEKVGLRPTPWRLTVSRASRRLAVWRAGRQLRRFSVVVGKPSTPTPQGLFSIVGAWRGAPGDFTGTWVLGLTAHSDALLHFEGGSGEVGIHGRGGASLLDPLGSAASHGCIRLANPAIGWLVRAVGVGRLAGIPVRVD